MFTVAKPLAFFTRALYCYGELCHSENFISATYISHLSLYSLRCFAFHCSIGGDCTMFVCRELHQKEKYCV